MSFDLDALVADCRAVRAVPDAQARIADLLRAAVDQPGALAKAVEVRKNARPKSASMAEVFINDDDLTIYQLSFPPYLWGAPHDHAAWAVIGVYSGAEAFNVYEEKDGSLIVVNRCVVAAGEVALLPAHLIHDIENPTGVASGSIHVYGNRHFDHPDRRIWRNTNETAEPFSSQKSLEYGLELTRRRRGAGLTHDRRAVRE